MPDYPRLVRVLGEAAEEAAAARPDERAVHRLVALAAEALGAVGASYAEYGPDGGRIIAAYGQSSWALGRRVDPGDERARRLLAMPERCVDLPVDELPAELAAQVSARGLRRVVIVRIERRGALAGTLHVYHRDPTHRTTADERSVLTLVADTVAAHRDRGAAARPAYAAGRDLADLIVAMTSHELRTPVTVIKGYAELLGEKWDRLGDDERRGAATVISQRAAELAVLVDRLVGAAAGDRSAASGSWARPFDLVEVLRTAVVGLPAGLGDRLAVDLPTGLPLAYGDPATVPRALTELVTNARKYSTDGGHIKLTAAADERTVYFDVADRGLGIGVEEAERAFDRFWQAEAEDDRRFGGVGLGLYLVRQLIERQNGWVSLRPRPNGGTVAQVRLPRAAWDLGGEA